MGGITLSFSLLERRDADVHNACGLVPIQPCGNRHDRPVFGDKKEVTALTLTKSAVTSVALRG